MTIELSNLTFTDQDDIVPQSGYAPILNTGIVNTLAGNDSITGSGIGNDGLFDYGFKNAGVLNTDDGNDTITGSVTYERFGNNNGYNIINFDTLNTGEGNDIIDGSYLSNGYAVFSGIYNPGTLNTGEGDDTITAFGSDSGFINEAGTVNTGGGNDIITAGGGYNYDSYGVGLSIWDGGTINTGNGEDSIIISAGGFTNSGEVFLGEDNDSLIAGGSRYNYDFLENFSLENFNTIETGNGNDIITSYSAIYNQGIINTGDGNDSIIANDGFESGPNSSGAWFLGEGEDYINGFGSGDFYGGNGNDTLELTPGTYTVGIWDTSATFTKDNQLMITSEFEQLIAGGTTYNFANLTAGQTIVVA